MCKSDIFKNLTPSGCMLEEEITQLSYRHKKMKVSSMYFPQSIKR